MNHQTKNNPLGLIKITKNLELNFIQCKATQNSENKQRSNERLYRRKAEKKIVIQLAMSSATTGRLISKKCRDALKLYILKESVRQLEWYCEYTLRESSVDRLWAGHHNVPPGQVNGIHYIVSGAWFYDLGERLKQLYSHWNNWKTNLYTRSFYKNYNACTLYLIFFLYIIVPHSKKLSLPTIADYLESNNVYHKIN